MYSRVCATGHITDPVPLTEKFHRSSIHQVIIITGLNKLYNSEDGLRCRLGVKLPLKLNLNGTHHSDGPLCSTSDTTFHMGLWEIKAKLMTLTAPGTNGTKARK